MRALRYGAFVMALAACHPQTGPGMGGARQNVITQEEIDATDATNIYDVIARLRGLFLNDRGRVSIKTNTHSRAMVFLNDQEYGIPETMRNIPIGRVGEIRYYPPTDAVARFGAQYGGGVILLVSRNN